MAQNEVNQYDEVAANNVDLNGQTVVQTQMYPPGVPLSFRNLMAALKRTFRSDLFRIRDVTTQTKLLAFDLSAFTAATTRTVSFPDKSGTVALISDTGNSSSVSNLSVVASVAASALTLAIKGYDGNDPSATNPVYVPFRSATAASGDIDILTLTAATSLVVSSGSTLGSTSAVAATYIVVGFNDAGTFRLGVINPNGAVIPDGIASSTAEGGAGAADSASVFYTGTAVTAKPYTVLGYLVATEATAGTWATAPSTVQTGQSGPTALAVMPFTKEYVSAAQTITLAGLLTLTHGLGGSPKLVQIEAVCTTADKGYSVGDVVLLPNHADNGGTGAGIGFSVTKTTTTLLLRIGDTSFSQILDKSTGAAGVTPTAARWQLVVRAWA